jgi:hypothetical protein
MFIFDLFLLFFFLVDFCRPFPLSGAQNPPKNDSVVCLVIKCEDAFLCGVKSFLKIKCENFMQMRFLFSFFKVAYSSEFRTGAVHDGPECVKGACSRRANQLSGTFTDTWISLI